MYQCNRLGKHRASVREGASEYPAVIGGMIIDCLSLLLRAHFDKT